MKPGALHMAWGMLMALSLASTLLSVPAIWLVWPVAAGVGVLILAWLKARIILKHYLGLSVAPGWQRGFDITLAIFLALLLGLYLAALAI